MSLSIDSGPVAIVGASCLLPGADSLERYWELLMERRCQVGALPEQVWRWERYEASLPESQPPPRLGAVLPAREVPWMRYRVPPNERPLVHRQEGLLIEVVERALESARLGEGADRSRIGLYAGSMGLGLSSPRIFTLRTRLQQVEQGLRRSLAFGRLDEATRARVLREFRARFDAHVDGTEGFPDVAAWAASGVAMGRVCNALDLRGPHLSLDAGEASAFAAIEAAVRQLRQGDQDVMVVAAHGPLLSPVLLHQLAHMGWLGSGPSRPFDEGAGGSVAGEGMGAVVLKRLADAVRDGDSIHGVIRGIGGGSQGRSRCAPTPDEATLTAVLERAHAQAGYGLDAVDFIETHGAGLPDWDAAELGALKRALGPDRRRPLALGMVKALLGNQLAGAGMSGLLKVLLAMRHRTLPPEVPVQRPLEPLRGEGGFEVRATASSWQPRAAGEPLRAGVTALGMGGTHYHLAVESYEPAYHQRLLASVPRPRVHEHFAVAVVGMGSVLPGAPDVPGFLEQLRAK
ncbi:MAG TPA: polyketide synthase, partial [Myxococcus sp.]|nr:polyketide synthase [Myxococcus sp.]